MLEPIISTLALLLAAIALITHLKKRSKRGEEYSDVLLAIVDEYTRRMNKLEAKLVDLEVSLDILMSQAKKVRENKEERKKIVMEDVISREEKSSITKFHSKLGDFELSILRCVSEGSKTPNEVRAVVGHSREHVARALKNLYEAGFLYREGGKPFVYSLTDKGRAVLSGVNISV